VADVRRRIDAGDKKAQKRHGGAAVV